MKKHVRATTLATAAVVAGIITAVATAGVAAAADEEIIGQGSVTIDFTGTPGSVEVAVWTKNLSAVPAWGRAVVRDRDGAFYDFGPRLYAAGEEWTYTKTLAGYTCADLGSVNGIAFGFADEGGVEPEWTSGVVAYPDPRITVIGCDVEPNPTGEEPEEPGEEPEVPGVTPEEPGVTPIDSPADTGTVAVGPTAVNTLPAAKTDGALVAGPSSGASSGASPLVGLVAAVGAILAALAGGAFAGALRRR